jgi:hypothetical protein
VVIWKNLKDYWTKNCKEVPIRRLKRCLSLSIYLALWAIEMFLRRLASSSLWLRPNELTSFLDEDGIPLRWHLVERLYKELERNYRPAPLDCRGIVVRPEFLDHHGAVRAPDEYLGWKTLFNRGAEAISVPGNHFSMVREHNRALAGAIDLAIKDQLREQTRPA